MIINTTGQVPACPDWRHISRGIVIPIGFPAGYHYADQPYIIEADDGALVCIATTGKQHEGQAGQHIRSLRSTDNGKTWEDAVALEPEDGPEASYAVLLKAPNGRIFAFYNHNTDNVRRVPFGDPNCMDASGRGDGYCYRVDSLGYFVFKYSDDNAKSWSARRHTVDVRLMEIDRNNSSGGSIRYFWNVGRPFVFNGEAHVPLYKVGAFGEGFFVRTEGVILKSENLLSIDDPAQARFQTLPDGEHGIRVPERMGKISEEHSFSVLSDGTFFVVFRTVSGHPACAYSYDNGHTWTQPDAMRYADGRPMKHPRAANFCWRHSSGYYLYWFHNHGGKDYSDRNPVWICAGREVPDSGGTKLEWSQPEILLYDDDPFLRMSYPDMFEKDGDTFFTETEKRIARIHRVDPEFLRRLFASFDACEMQRDALVCEWDELRDGHADSVPAPEFPLICYRKSGWDGIYSDDSRLGFTIEFSLIADQAAGSMTLLDNRTADGKGFCVLKAQGRIEIILCDGRSNTHWSSSQGWMESGTCHHVSIIVDGGPKTISFVIDGKFDDGGSERQFGFGLFNCHFQSANGAKAIRIGSGSSARVSRLRIYERAVMVCEAVANHRALTVSMESFIG